jgi:pimeloyl-ACP methyl ester carboxylesterase
MRRNRLALVGLLPALALGARDTASEPVATSAPSAAEPVAPLCNEIRAPRVKQACLVAGELARGRTKEVVSRFKPSLARALPEARLTRAWRETTKDLGPITGVRTLSTEKAQQSEHVELLVRFARGERLVDVVVDSTGRISTLGFGPAPRVWEPPSYADRIAFVEVSLTVGRPPALPALLTLPRHGQRMPGVVMVHGSGPTDEDCSAHPLGFGNKPCKDLAWGLASRGIAVLRYRKRSLVETEPLDSLAEEVVRDVCAARSLLAARPEIDPARVALIGHSLGGALAPRIYRACGGFAGLVLLASPARPMAAVLAGQIAYLRWRAGNSELTSQEVNELHQLEKRVMQSGADPGEELAMLGSVAPRSYWRDLFSLDPAREARDLTLPMLVIQGERDYQVALADWELWQKTSRHPRHVLAKRYPGLDHDLVPGSGPSSHYDYYEARHVDPEVLVDISRWVTNLRPR